MHVRKRVDFGQGLYFFAQIWYTVSIEIFLFHFERTAEHSRGDLYEAQQQTHGAGRLGVFVHLRLLADV